MVRYGDLGSDTMISYRIQAYKKAGLIVSLSGTVISISVEDCFEIRVGMNALFPASGLRQNFEMARSGGVVDRDFPIFAHWKTIFSSPKPK